VTRGGDLLPGALQESLQAGAGTNAALGVLLDDFVRYHAVLVGLGGAVAAALLVLGGWCWRRSGRVNAGAGGAWTFERRVYVSFGGTGIVSGLLMAVIVAANVSTVLHPGPGSRPWRAHVRTRRPERTATGCSGPYGRGWSPASRTSRRSCVTGWRRASRGRGRRPR